ncbi:MAG TPA: hypothetical protein VFT47_08945 [Vicinamibacterales bacterium]|nr:hypothetical protein [Vicinamibacterales bacterium]
MQKSVLAWAVRSAVVAVVTAITVGKTAMGGNELVGILRRAEKP